MQAKAMRGKNHLLEAVSIDIDKKRGGMKTVGNLLIVDCGT